ncbi:MAG: orotidine-5'-phosphate decarboxylase [Alphaproteobacteria bacterium]
MTKSQLQNAVLCGLDTPDVERARALIQSVKPHVGGFKLGLEFFNANGPEKLGALIEEEQVPVFADLKFHDIPNTVAGAVRSLLTYAKPFMLNVHASGGAEMMQRAVQMAEDMQGADRPQVIAVTILTSLDEPAMGQVGFRGSPSDMVRRLAALAQEAGLDGVVCSAHEVAVLRADLGDDFTLVVPGIRPAGSAVNDQKRVMTPRAALDAGATHLVIARPIIAADDPVAAAKSIAEEIA